MSQVYSNMPAGEAQLVAAARAGDPTDLIEYLYTVMLPPMAGRLVTGFNAAYQARLEREDVVMAGTELVLRYLPQALAPEIRRPIGWLRHMLWLRLLDYCEQQRCRAGSLEVYLAPRAGEDGPVRELADRPMVSPVSPLLQQSILRLLGFLTEKQMLAVTAEYGIDMPQREALTRDQVMVRLGVSRDAYDELCKRALRSLRVYFSQPGKRLSVGKEMSR